MSSKFNLWKLLNEYRVIIPIIQRDYAQGRKENDYIRKTFLKDIKDCLCSEPPEQLTLDFIYGNIECKNCDDKRFYPLDGQQRLTTLWLVYWYVSFKSGKLSKDSEQLKKFTYETRRSSRDFCIALKSGKRISVSRTSFSRISTSTILQTRLKCSTERNARTL